MDNIKTEDIHSDSIITSEYTHPDSYNTGNFERPVITYEEYINKEDSKNAINQSSDNT